MMKPDVKPGIVAKSLKGRDKNRLFMVLYEVDADFVVICDGKLRKLCRPKKKRRKHLRALPHELPELMELFKAGRLKDSDVRKAIAKIEEEKHGE
jgi:ribosomal protein L14E/L6E/L27E